MRVSGTSVIAWGLWGVALVLIAASGLLILLGFGLPADRLTDLGMSVILLAFATVGAVVASRVPGNPVGWIFLSAGVLGGFVSGSGQYVRLAHAEGLPGAVPVAWSAQVFWLPALILLVTLPVVLFPDGHPPSPRWRWVVWVSLGASATVGLVGALAPVVTLPKVPNPLGVEALDPYEAPLGRVLLGVGLGLALLGFLGAVASMVARFRRSRGVERQQLKWFAYATAWAGLATPLLILIVLLREGADLQIPGWVEVTGSLLHLMAILALPIAIGLAVVRYRLYDIDRLISRTLVYAIVVGVLGAVYAGGIFVLRSLFPWEGDLAVAASTLAVAGLFNPLRHRTQRLVDRRFYRSRYDARQVVEGFSDRLRDQVDLDVLTEELVSVVEGTLHPTRVDVWLRAERT